MLVDQRDVGREASEVGAGAEDLVARAGEDDRTHRIVVAGALHRFDEGSEELAVERVALVGAVQGDRRDPVLDLVEELIRHRQRSLVDLGRDGKCYVLLPTLQSVTIPQEMRNFALVNTR